MRSRIQPISRRRSKALAEYAIIKRAWFRDPANQICALPGCTRPAKDVHHTRGRAGSLLIDTNFWKPLCRRHHDWVGMNPAAARDLGLLCQAGKWNVPHRRD